MCSRHIMICRMWYSGSGTAQGIISRWDTPTCAIKGLLSKYLLWFLLFHYFHPWLSSNRFQLYMPHTSHYFSCTCLMPHTISVVHASYLTQFQLYMPHTSHYFSCTCLIPHTISVVHASFLTLFLLYMPHISHYFICTCLIPHTISVVHASYLTLFQLYMPHTSHYF
jgi:hypothetical protein